MRLNHSWAPMNIGRPKRTGCPRAVPLAVTAGAVSGCALSWVFALLVLVATIDVPSQSIWIAGVVRTPFSTAFRLGPAALGVQGPITDHCSPPQFGPDPAGPGMRPAGSSVSQ